MPCVHPPATCPLLLPLYLYNNRFLPVKSFYKILHQAVIDGDLEVVSFLIENDANINAQDNEGLLIYTYMLRIVYTCIAA